MVRDELAEGAEQMSKLSMERLSLSTCVDELKSKYNLRLDFYGSFIDTYFIVDD